MKKLIIIIILFRLNAYAQMATSSMSLSNSGIGTSWTFTNNIPSLSNIPPNGFSKNLIGNNLQFNIPANANITGISLELTNASSQFTNLNDTLVQLIKNGSPVGYKNNPGNIHATPNPGNPFVYGGENDTWGENWIPFDINNPQFGFLLSVHNLSPSVNNLDFTAPFTITVYFTALQGINEYISSNQKLYFFPNPVYNKIHIPNLIESTQYQIFDINSKLIKSGAAESEIDISYFQVGTYFIQIKNNNGSISNAKFIKSL